MSEHVVGARRLLDPVRVLVGEHPHPLDRLADVPALVRVGHEEAVGSELASEERGAAHVIFEVRADLHLDRVEAVCDRLAAQRADLVVVVPEPTCRRGVGGISVALELGDAVGPVGLLRSQAARRRLSGVTMSVR